MEKSVGLVVFRKTRHKRLFLLLKYPAGHWDFVKGHVERGEAEEQTALRELQEETGITQAGIIDGFRERINYGYTRNRRFVRKQVIFRLARTRQSRVALSYEHVDYAWLDYEKARERLTFANSRNILDKAESVIRELEQVECTEE